MAMSYEIHADPPIFHAGEYKAQQKAWGSSLPYQNTDWVLGDMSASDIAFYSSIPTFVIGTQDADGNLWCSILCGEPGFIQCPQSDTMIIKTSVPSLDPITSNILVDGSDRLFGGVGVMHHNRRRNKCAGTIQGYVSSSATPGISNVFLQATVTQAYGNCPKYINLRTLKYRLRDDPNCIVSGRLDAKEELLPSEVISYIHGCDTMFVVSKRESAPLSDMDANHRGGPRGFVRVMADMQSFVIPDYSGNRLMQTLGNIEENGAVGVTFPDYETGAILYITGHAVNYYHDEAKSIFPGFQRVTVVKVLSYRLVENGLHVESLAGAPGYSPYNPPLRYLSHEAVSDVRPRGVVTPITMKIMSSKNLSPSIRTFTFELSEEVLYKPGQYVIADFSEAVSVGYRHMNDANPKLLNDDLQRSWTITSFPPIDAATRSILPSRIIEVTIKKKEGGLISTLLHGLKAKGRDDRRGAALMEGVRFSGVAGSFSCFDNLAIKHARILVIAAGVGITPFLSMWEGLQQLSRHGFADAVDINLLFTCRGSDAEVLSVIAPPPAHVKFNVTLFTTDSVGSVRLDVDALRKIDGISGRHVYLCGPKRFMEDMASALELLSVDPAVIHTESFAF